MQGGNPGSGNVDTAIAQARRRVELNRRVQIRYGYHVVYDLEKNCIDLQVKQDAIDSHDFRPDEAEIEMEVPDPAVNTRAAALPDISDQFKIINFNVELFSDRITFYTKQTTPSYNIGPLEFGGGAEVTVDPYQIYIKDDAVVFQTPHSSKEHQVKILGSEDQTMTVEQFKAYLAKKRKEKLVNLAGYAFLASLAAFFAGLFGASALVAVVAGVAAMFVMKLIDTFKLNIDPKTKVGNGIMLLAVIGMLGIAALASFGLPFAIAAIAAIASLNLPAPAIVAVSAFALPVAAALVRGAEEMIKGLVKSVKARWAKITGPAVDADGEALQAQAPAPTVDAPAASGWNCLSGFCNFFARSEAPASTPARTGGNEVGMDPLSLA